MAAGTFVPVCSALLLVSSLVSAEQNVTTAESGKNVALTCQITNSNVDVIEWSRADLGTEYVLLYQDGHFVPDNQHPSFKDRVELQDRWMKDGNVSLILKNVTINDTGTYECRVKSGTGSLNLISIITLRVSAPPGPGGGTSEDGGSAGLIVALSVAVVLLVAAAGFLIYRKRKQSQDLYLPPDELQPV